MPPVGFKRSRALWDNARRPHASKWDAVRPYVRAVAYELQPIRSSQLPQGRTVGRALRQGAAALVSHAHTVYTLLRHHTTRRHWQWAACALAYYAAVRWIHAALDAGPIILIASALVGIFTIGLSDEGNADGISAYSVFNRGFARLLGTVEAEDLVAQQMGGGMRIHRGGGENHNHIVEPPPPRRQAAQEPPPAAPDDNANNDDNDNAANNNDDNNNNRARLSGKKARGRRNLEQRRELRRQREAALAMGFGGDDEGLALQRLLQEQHDLAAADDNDE